MPSSLQLQRPTAAPTTNTTISAAAGDVSAHKQQRCLSVVPDALPGHHHAHKVGPGQCCSYVVQTIDAPASVVWSVVSRFDNPQAYKHFVKSCNVVVGDGRNVGALREVRVVSGLPAARSTERLEILDDEHHVLSFSVVGGDHRLHNYRSITTLHASGTGTVVIESFVVDVPAGNTREETCTFVDTIVRCNLQSLAQIAENMARTSP
ncbi:hypothetical protein ACOSP7_032299 [Xanthoceras sorbifolium]